MNAHLVICYFTFLVTPFALAEIYSGYTGGIDIGNHHGISSNSLVGTGVHVKGGYGDGTGQALTHPVNRPVAVPVPQPYRVSVQVPVQVPVPQPYPISVPQPHPVQIPQTILVPVPRPVDFGGNFGSSFEGGYGGISGGFSGGLGGFPGGFEEGKGPSYSYTTVQVGGHDRHFKH